MAPARMSGSESGARDTGVQRGFLEVGRDRGWQRHLEWKGHRWGSRGKKEEEEVTRQREMLQGPGWRSGDTERGHRQRSEHRGSSWGHEEMSTIVASVNDVSSPSTDSPSSH